jgi:hypothetical protein
MRRLLGSAPVWPEVVGSIPTGRGRFSLDFAAAGGDDGGMSPTQRTDSDRLDDLIEAAEKQTAAINRLAMAVQEEGTTTRPKFLWWLTALSAIPAFAMSVLNVIGTLGDKGVGILAVFLILTGCLYVLAKCNDAISQ